VVFTLGYRTSEQTQILVKAKVFFWLARREFSVILLKQVHYQGLNHAAHHQSCKLSFHKDKK